MTGIPEKKKFLENFPRVKFYGGLDMLKKWRERG